MIRRDGGLKTSGTAGLIGALLLAMVIMAHPREGVASEATEIVCIQCHGSLPGKYGEPVKLWRGSVHAENGIACNACHGGDPKDAANAMDEARGFLGAPEEAEIPAFCGRCHVGVLQEYLSSAHGKALGKGGPTCVTCHGNHRVVKATLDIIDEKSCGRCHGFERAQIIKSAMSETEGMLVTIDTRITGFKQEGIDTDRQEKSLFAERNRFHSLFHTVEVEQVKKESAQIQGELKKIDAVLQGYTETRQQRRLAGVAAVCGALLFALVVYLLRKTYD